MARPADPDGVPATTGADRSAQLLFERHPDALYALDGEGRFSGCNPAFEVLCGYRADELRTLPRAPFLHPDDAERVHDEFLRALAGQRPTFEARGIARDGTGFVVDVTYLPVVVDGTVERVFGIAQDVSEKVTARHALEASERRFRGLFEGAAAGIAITTTDGRFVDANPACLAMLGCGLDEARAVDLRSVVHPDDLSAVMRGFSDLLTDGTTTLGPAHRWLAADGTYRWVRSKVSRIADPTDAPALVALTLEDVTDTRAAQQRLRRSEHLRRLAGGLARVGGWALDRDRTVFWSDEVYAIIDAPAGDEPPLDVIMERYPADSRTRLETAIAACFATGDRSTWRSTSTRSRVDGSPSGYWRRLSTTPMAP